MAYILTAQRVKDNAFARYRSYLEGPGSALPPGAKSLATSDWYFSSSDHRCPHDSWLESVEVAEAGEINNRTLSVRIRLLGAYDDGHIDLHYSDVSHYSIGLISPRKDRGHGHRDWRYDEFRLARGNRVEHEIEWWGQDHTATWLIEAADVHYEWLPRQGW